MVSYATEPAVRRSAREVPTLSSVRPGPGGEEAAGAVRALTRVGPLTVDVVPAHLLEEDHLLAWTRLFDAQPTPSNPFMSSAWVLAWYEQFVAPENRLVLVVRQEKGPSSAGDIVAIAPMHLHRPKVGPLPIARRLLPAGAGLGQSGFEIPGFLCRADQTTAAQRAVIAACLELPVHWSELALTPEQGWLDGQWGQGTEDAMAFGEFTRPRACVILPLRDSWEATRSHLKRNVKESIRRSANRLVKDGRPFEVRRHGSDLDRAAVERFLQLHRARASVSRATNRHHPDSYSDDRNRKMMVTALPQLGLSGQASMFELYLDGEHVASQLALHSPGTSYVHSSGFREDTWSLGVVTHLQAELLRHAIERGDEVVNFSPGPSVSKTRWSDQLWSTNEFAFGSGPRSLTPRLATFQMLSALRATLYAADRRRAQLQSAQH